MRRARISWRVLLLVGASAAVSVSARADEASVPLQLQVELTTKVIEYMQEPPLSSTDRVRIGIVVKPGRPESERAGAELKVAFDRMPATSGHTHEQAILDWSGAKSLVEEARRLKLTVLYFTAGLDAEVAAAARALEGQGLVTITAVDSYVHSGAILGFELISGHPKMMFNLAQAKKQGVALRAAVMKLMRIVE